MQDEVAKDVAREEIRVRVNRARTGSPQAASRPVDPEAYEAYLKGLYFLEQAR